MVRRRGQVGIGTLIVFIAMILVAAIAAGVLIDTAGTLQTQAEATGEESIEQVSGRLRVISATGNVTGNNTIDYFNFTVAKAPGSGNIDLENVSYEVVTSDEVVTYTLGKAVCPCGDPIRPLTAQTNDDVITAQSDRYIFALNAGERQYELHPRESLTITFTTASGASTTEVVTVPKSLAGRSKVRF